MRGEFLNGYPDFRRGDQRFVHKPREVLQGIQTQAVVPQLLIPIECGFDISLNRSVGFDGITYRLDFRVRRSITSNAGIAVAGFSR
jgi:hypothetical protein